MSPIIDEALRNLVREVVREELRAHFSGPARDTELPRASVIVSGGGVYLSTKRAAQIAGVHPATVREWVRRGFLQERHAGRLLRVDVVELRAFLERPQNTDGEVLDLDKRAAEILERSARGQQHRRRSTTR